MALKAKHLSKDDLTRNYQPEPGKGKQLRKPVPPHLTKHGVRTTRVPSKAKAASEKRTGETPEKSASELRERRQALRKKLKAGTATPAERKELNRLVGQLKKRTK